MISIILLHIYVCFTLLKLAYISIVTINRNTLVHIRLIVSAGRIIRNTTPVAVAHVIVVRTVYQRFGFFAVSTRLHIQGITCTNVMKRCTLDFNCSFRIVIILVVNRKDLGSE